MTDTQAHRTTFRRLALRMATALGVMTFIAALSGGCAMMSIQSRKPITVPEIVQMSNNGMASDDIIGQIKASGTVYRLKASQLVDLNSQGVSDAVINYMQQTYLDAVKWEAGYENWDHWTRYDDYWYGGSPYGWPSRPGYIIRGTGAGN